eukprot:scaffold15102_cov101-Isochrysis_galbana.AAC.4
MADRAWRQVWSGWEMNGGKRSMPDRGPTAAEATGCGERGRGSTPGSALRSSPAGTPARPARPPPAPPPASQLARPPRPPEAGPSPPAVPPPAAPATRC